jgi:hypothetical protein
VLTIFEVNKNELYEILSFFDSVGLLKNDEIGGGRITAADFLLVLQKKNPNLVL